MKKAYICSPYRAQNTVQLNRNIAYARELTKQALKAGMAPIAPHLYMTRCMDKERPEERKIGIEAGLELLKVCDYIVVGIKYGISEGMSEEIKVADLFDIDMIRVVNAVEFQRCMKAKMIQVEDVAWDFAKACVCNFCTGSKLHSCTGYDCREPYQRAYEYAMSHKELL